MKEEFVIVVNTMGREDITRFPERIEGETPVSLYEKIYPSISSDRKETYVSSPITGGPAREYIRSLKKEISSNDEVIETIKANQAFMETVSGLLVEKNHDKHTFAYKIGERKGWKELDYNKFWLYYLSGIKPDRAGGFELYMKKAGINETIFNDFTLSHDRRAEEYGKLLDTFSDFVNKDELNKVSKIYFMPGSKESLGCRFEQKIAEKLSIPAEFIVFDSSHKDYSEKVKPVAPWLEKFNTDHNGEDLFIFQSN